MKWIPFLFLFLLSGCIKNTEWESEIITYNLDAKSLTYKFIRVKPKLKEGVDEAWEELQEFLKFNGKVDESNHPYLITYVTDVEQKVKSIDVFLKMKIECATDTECDDKISWHEFFEILEQEAGVVNGEIYIFKYAIPRLNPSTNYTIESNLKQTQTDKTTIYYMPEESNKIMFEFTYTTTEKFLGFKNLPYIGQKNELE